MYEEGRVTQLTHEPRKTEVYFGTDSEGNFKLKERHIPEKYIVGFSCEHGGFKLSDRQSKEYFYNFIVGDEVIISYRQVDLIETKDGKEIGRHFHDWEFVDAKKINRDGPKEQ